MTVSQEEETGRRHSTLLQIVPVRIHGTAGSYKDTHALLDSGADTSLCEEHVLKELGIDGNTEELRLSNVEGSGENRPSMGTSLQVSPLSSDADSKTVTVPEVFSVTHLNVRPQRINWSQKDR